MSFNLLPILSENGDLINDASRHETTTMVMVKKKLDTLSNGKE
jgi:hypothetical protein